GKVKEGDLVLASVDKEKRRLTAANHSATHLLFKALRDRLGSHVSQQGSQVSAEALRFDFNHFETIADETILELERTVNEMIVADYPVVTRQMSVEAAVARGAMAEFGEKYGDTVRVVDLKHTLDLCGGPHVNKLPEIGRFAIRGIPSIGSGIYRIEALTSSNVMTIVASLQGINAEMENLLKKAYGILQSGAIAGISLTFTPPAAVEVTGSYRDVIRTRLAFAELQQAVKELEKAFQQRQETATLQSLERYYDMIEGGIFIGRVDGLDVNTLKQFVDNLAVKATGGLVFVASVKDDKVTFVAKSKSLRYHCGSLVKAAATICGGNGGGRPDFAQAGGKDVAMVDQAVIAVKRLVR
ncbi:MAG: DHHA1 domain-containing protein, partial [bacterium]